MSRLFILIFIFVSSAIIFGCDSYDDAQREFERQAMQAPEGITETNANGEVRSEDPDDWRISPMYDRLLEVTVPAYPNPTQNDQVFIELNIFNIEAVNGLSVETFQENFGQQYFRVLYVDERSPLPTGYTTIEISPVEFSPQNSYEDAIGIHRVLIYDRRGNLITYGDVEVR